MTGNNTVEYTLKLKSSQVQVVLHALDLLNRVIINQPENVTSAALDGLYNRIGSEEFCRRRDKANVYMKLAFKEIFPDWNEITKTKEWYISYNVLQALRYQRHLAEYPDSLGVDSYPPMSLGGQPVPECAFQLSENKKENKKGTL